MEELQTSVDKCNKPITGGVNMKNKIKLCFLGFLLIIILLLVIYTIKRTPQCNRVHIDDMVAFIVPDEEMARDIADAVMDIGEVKDYDVKMNFDESNNEWVVTYIPKGLAEDEKISGQRVVRIRKDSGIITTYSDR